MTFLSTHPIYQLSPPAIDKENAVIKNVLIIQEGEARGHDLFLNQQFLDDVVKLGNQKTNGVKARFGHPNMCSTALGTFIGRYKNFHKIGTLVYADFYLDASAKISPNGNLFDYILQLAETNPDTFGSSIAFKPGKTITLSEKDPTTNETMLKSYATIELLHAVDLVDDPAATNGLFSQFHADDLSFIATTFLDQNPLIVQSFINDPSIFFEFISKYFNRNNMNLPENFKTFIDKIALLFQTPEPLPDPLPDPLPEPQPQPLIDPSMMPDTEPSPEPLPQPSPQPALEPSPLPNPEPSIEPVPVPQPEPNPQPQMLPVEFAALSNQIIQLQNDLLLKDAKIQELESKLNVSANDINQLQTDIDILNATKSTPSNIADPALSLSKKSIEDNSGKLLLNELSHQDRLKLKSKN